MGSGQERGWLHWLLLHWLCLLKTLNTGQPALTDCTCQLPAANSTCQQRIMMMRSLAPSQASPAPARSGFYLTLITMAVGKEQLKQAQTTWAGRPAGIFRSFFSSTRDIRRAPPQ